MAFISEALFSIGFVAPLVAAVIAIRSSRRKQWWLLLFASAVISWICLIGGDQAFYESIRLEYERTGDPDLLRRYTNDAGSGLLVVFGIFATLIWSGMVFLLSRIVWGSFCSVLRRTSSGRFLPDKN
jgi:hypothetical protein